MKFTRYPFIYLALVISSFLVVSNTLFDERVVSKNIFADTNLISKQEQNETINTANAPGDACTGLASNAIGGTVWEDWNYNGVQDENTLIGVEGILVSLIDDCNNTINSIETDADGDFLFSNLNTTLTYRIEFTIPDALSWAKPTFVGADNGTSVQFTSTGNCVNLGVASPANYCEDNPLVAIPCYVNGDPTAGGTAASIDWFVYFRNDNQGEIGNGGYIQPETKVGGAVIGATWGTAYHRETQNVLASAVMKRHSGFGQNGTGAIYKIDASGTPSLFVDLNSYGNVNTGVDTRDGSTNNTLPSNFDVANRDINAFQAVGKVGIGDIDFSDDEKVLYAINLNERTLVVLNVGDDLTAPSSVNTYNIATAVESLYAGTSAACGNASDYRPWALKYHKGKLYIGVICSAEISRNSNDVHAYVLSFNPAQPQNGFAKVVDMPMNYDREPAFQSDVSSQTISGIWRYWASDYTDATILPWRGGAHPSPILSDIEIDDDGSMILAFMDRFGMQSGYRQLTTDLSDSNTDHQGLSAGDVIRYCKINDVLVREGGTGCNYNTSPPWTNPGDFVPKGEFYAHDEYFTTITNPNHGHPETSFGGLALLPGSGELLAGVMDPFTLRSGGVAWWDNTNGAANKEYELYESIDASTPDGSFSKAVGLGDLQFMCAPAPLQIGNYIWVDSDEDGIQDACETPMNGIAVSLYRAGTKIAETISSATGQYYFSDNTASDPNLTWYGTGADAALQTNTDYQVVFGESQYNNDKIVWNAQDYELTVANRGKNTTDNDATIMDINGTNYPTINITTGGAGEVDHSIDAGFKLLVCTVDIISVYADNCMDNNDGTFSALWNIDVAVKGNNDNALSYQRNSESIQNHTLTGKTASLQWNNIPADGGLSDTIKVWFTNEPTCINTVIIKRPVPCPTPVNNACTPTGVTTLTVEAEDFTSKFTSTGPDDDDWTLIADPSASGGQAMQSLDNDGSAYSILPDCCDAAGTNEAALMNFDINIPSNDTYYLYVRIRRDNSSFNDDSFHTGLNGTYLATTNNTFDQYTWSNTPLGSLTTGTQTINIWEREDGAIIDKIVVSTATSILDTAAFSKPASICDCGISNSQIAGTVFEDANYNGLLESDEIARVQGILVEAYNCDNTLIASTYSDENGNYQLNGLTTGEEYRIEFDLPETVTCWAKPTQAGNNNGTTVQFTTPGNCTSLGLASPGDFCEATAYFATPCYVFGDQDDPNNPRSTDGVMVSFKTTWGETAIPPSETSSNIADWQDGGTPQYLALANEIGTTYGTAYDNKQHKLYSSAFLKNFAGFGGSGPGAIYEMDINPNNGQVIPSSVKEYVQLNTLGVDVCADPHGEDLTNLAVLDDLIAEVGKCGLGDLEISDDGQFLYTVNLTTKEVVAIRIADKSLYAKWKVPHNQVETNDPETDIRPFGLAYKHGQLYVGVMSTAESTQDRNNIWAYVYQMDPLSGSFTQIFKANYATDFSTHSKAPWYNTWEEIRNDDNSPPEDHGDLVYTFSPILADIEFYGKDMTLSFRNRAADQWGSDIPDPLHPTPNTVVGFIQTGEILCVYWDGLKYVPESDGNCGINRRASETGVVGYPGNPAPEFYWGDGKNELYGGNGSHHDGAYGGLVAFGGDRIAWNSGSSIDAFGVQIYNYGAVGYLDQTNGEILQAYGIYQGLRDQGVFGKATGLGDLEAICTSPPIEIGNYVWEDSNCNGIQDACENPIPNINVSLYKNGTKIAQTQTSALGQYYFSDAAASDPNLTWSGTNADTTLLPNTAYQIVFGESQYSNNNLVINTTEYILTDAFQGDKTLIDSDAKELDINGITYPTISATTGDVGCVDHSFDVGFKPKPCPTLALTATDTICSDNTAALALNYSEFSGNVALYYNTGTRLDSTALYAAGNGGATFIDSTRNQVIINELSYVTGDTIELWNQGSNTVDISNWYLCAGFAYDRFNTTTVVNGSLQLGANQKVVLTDFPNINLSNSSEAMGIYNTNSFGSAAAMEDFVQWGAGGQARENVAVAKGIWTAGDFIPSIVSGLTLSYDGQGDTSADWSAETATFCSDNNNLNQAFNDSFTSPIFTNNTAAPITYYIYAILTENNDHINTNCMPVAIDSVVVTAIQINNLSTICNDNNTGGVETDDTFTIELTATAPKNNSTQFEVLYNGTVLNTGGTNYNALVTLSHPDFQATGSGTFTLTIRDKDEVGCSTSVNVTTPPNCSDCPIQTICLPITVTAQYGAGGQ